MHVTLLVPDLFWPRDDGGGSDREPELPAAVRLLSRARPRRFPPLSLEAWLCQAFDVERQQDWPIAPITLGYDGGDTGDDYWLRADPVHLALQRDRLVLIDAGVLKPGAEEAAELVSVLNRHFAAEGLSFDAPHPARWYLRVSSPPRLVTREISQAAGRDIAGALPSGEDCLRWQRTLNEIQMLLHGQPSNQRRESRGELPINSVWLWGGGRRAAVPGRHFSHVAAGNVLALALGARAGAAPAALDFIAVARPHVTGGPHAQVLIVAETPAARHGDYPAWREELAEIERAWFAPLLSALRRRILEHLAVVVLHPRACLRFDVSVVDLLKFWRPVQPLSAHAPGAT